MIQNRVICKKGFCILTTTSKTWPYWSTWHPYTVPTYSTMAVWSMFGFEIKHTNILHSEICPSKFWHKIPTPHTCGVTAIMMKASPTASIATITKYALVSQQHQSLQLHFRKPLVCHFLYRVTIFFFFPLLFLLIQDGKIFPHVFATLFSTFLSHISSLSFLLIFQNISQVSSEKKVTKRGSKTSKSKSKS